MSPLQGESVQQEASLHQRGVEHQFHARYGIRGKGIYKMHQRALGCIWSQEFLAVLHTETKFIIFIQVTACSLTRFFMTLHCAGCTQMRDKGCTLMSLSKYTPPSRHTHIFWPLKNLALKKGKSICPINKASWKNPFEYWFVRPASYEVQFLTQQFWLCYFAL